MGRAAAAPARRPPEHLPRRSPAAPPAHLPRCDPASEPRRPSPPAVPRGAAVLDALLHGRAWIAIVFVLLAGIVFFNVDLLRMNREIAAASERARAVKLQNARLRTDLARLGSSERIQRVAAARGLVLAEAGEVRYLRSNPAVDARRAAERTKAESADAQTQVAADAQTHVRAAVTQPQVGADAQTQLGAADVQPQPGAAGAQPQE